MQSDESERVARGTSKAAGSQQRAVLKMLVELSTTLNKSEAQNRRQRDVGNVPSSRASRMAWRGS